jgi:ABC-type multidrug transport system ATPase subunit
MGASPPIPRSRPLVSSTIPDGAALGPSTGGPELVVLESGRAVRVPLGRAPLTIGRDPTCGLVLGSGYVSAYHARVEPEGEGHRIVDVGSANGVLRAGRRLAPSAPATLSDGDVLRIGDPTTGGFVTLIYRNPGAQRIEPGAAVVRRHLLEGRPMVVIGRAGADIELDNPAVSRRHAVVEREGGGHAIHDLGAMNGTFVDGRRVSRAPLAKGAVVRIGPFKLVYDGQSLSQYDERGALRLDAQSLSQRVRGGRYILRDVSLSIAPREFVALVGGSGAGKSTLMKALAGYAEQSHGQVLVNGEDFYAQLDVYRALLGYVPQDDTLHRELPVDRALAYTARLRLPADTSGAEIDARVARVLDDVDMAAHREKRIDQLSGGQRKRVSIAAELLADPSLFFLDEPTSGLDPGLEKKMMYTLRRLADAGRTIVLVTHATANITQCDHVAFMAEGRLVYFGPPAGALEFFRVDSGDFADIYTRLEGYADPQDAERWAVAQGELAVELDAFRRGPEGDRAPSLAELWEMRYRRSPAYAAYVARRSAEIPEPERSWWRPRQRLRPPGISSLFQLLLLGARYVHVLFQDRKNLLLLLLQAPVIGYLMTLVARSDSIVGPKADAVDAKTVLFMLSTVAVWFGIINAAREITKESPVFRRERLAGLRVSAYVLSKVLVLALLVVVQSVMLLGVLGTEVRFPRNGVLLDGTLELGITTALTSLAGLSLGLAISAWAKTPDRAISFVPLALIPQILFSGVLFPFGSGITTTRVLSWFTVSRWAMDAYGATIKLARLPPPSRVAQPEFAATAANLLDKWQILGVYTLACLVLTWALLLVRDDER